MKAKKSGHGINYHALFSINFKNIYKATTPPFHPQLEKPAPLELLPDTKVLRGGVAKFCNGFTAIQLAGWFYEKELLPYFFNDLYTLQLLLCRGDRGRIPESCIRR
jgi:hypothetical protein